MRYIARLMILMGVRGQCKLSGWKGEDGMSERGAGIAFKMQHKVALKYTKHRNLTSRVDQML
jgi:hypothetical protein